MLIQRKGMCYWRWGVHWGCGYAKGGTVRTSRLDLSRKRRYWWGC